MTRKRDRRSSPPSSFGSRNPPSAAGKQTRKPAPNAEQRPPRKYYKLTRSGRETLEASQKRYPLLAKLATDREVGTL